MSYKTTNGLMRHFRDNGIDIHGSRQKIQLVNTGYFHGYKGYRFFINSKNRLPFVSYDEIFATIQYDSKLKALLYEKIMFIETAVKNIALECILIKANSENLQDIYDKLVIGYHNAPQDYTPKQRQELQQKKLNLQNSIQASLASAYKKNNPQITHFYNNAGYSGVPIWALFEIMTMGDFANFLSCLTIDVREYISRKIGLNLASDTNRTLVYKYIYSLKDLRNAIAHNAVVFDTRFRKFDPTPAMKSCIKNEIGLPYFNFSTIGDYIILMCYYLKMLNMTKRSIKKFIYEFEKITEEYRKSVNNNVAAIVIHPDLYMRMKKLKKYI